MKTNKNYKINDKTVRFIYALSLASLLFFVGCDQGSELTSPFAESPDQQLKVTSDFTLSGQRNTRNPYLDRKEEYPPGSDSLFFPMKLPGSEIPNLRVSELIDGKKGGKLEIDYEFETSKGNTIRIQADLDIPDNAFDGEEEISMIVNNEISTITFYPKIIFNETLEFNIKYTGIDLSGIDPDSIDFVFQNYDGSTEQINYYDLKINISDGKLELKKADINHFSRYGFVN